MVFTVGSLFSGIGGFELGFQKASTENFKILWQIENDPFCIKILEKNFPDVIKYKDIITIDPKNIDNVDILCGGFPCQPYSIAGKRCGINDDRYLWPEFYKFIINIKSNWVIIENVKGLLSIDEGKIFRGILRDLANAGYDAEWQVLPAKAFGAPHKRDRVFIVAYPISKGLPRSFFEAGICGFSEQTSTKFGNRSIACGDWWRENISNIRMGNGIPLRVARPRVKAYGNAVCPQIIEFLAKRILELEEAC